MMKHAENVILNAKGKGVEVVADAGISVTMVYPILKTLLHQGHDQKQLFDRANLDPDILRDNEARLSNEQFVRLTEAAAEISSDEAFGLHQGQRVEVSDLGVIGYVMLHSSTIGQAIAAYQKYNLVVCSGYNISWKAEGDDAVIEMTYDNLSGQPGRHCMEDMVSTLYHLMMKLCCQLIPLKEVQFTHRLHAKLGEYIAVLGVVPRYGCAVNTIRISKEVLDYPIVLADPRLLATFESIAEEARHKLISGRLLSAELYQWIIKSIPHGMPNIKGASRAFQMSVRSLQDKLKQEQTTYQEMISRVRKELAAGYLARPEHRISEIAYLLHFSEPSAFHNAFKKWTGTTPKQYRAEVLGDRQHQRSADTASRILP
jgi:AraC-like DNA-binding protein